MKQVLYCAYIGLAASFAVNIFIFPFTAREPYLNLTSSFLDTIGAMITQHADHFSSFHIRYREHQQKKECDGVSGTDSTNSEKNESARKKKKTDQKDDAPDEIAKLQGMRAGLAAIASAHEMAKVPAKREFAYGHLRSSEIEKLHKMCRSLIIPVFGCNLWSQIAGVIRSDHKETDFEGTMHTDFLTSLGATTEFGMAEEARIFETMETDISPRIKALSASCSESLAHIKRSLHLGIYKRPPFYVRPFVDSPHARTDGDINFSDTFEADIARFWESKHIAINATDSTGAIRPHVASLLIMYMESTLHAMALRLLTFSRWADELHSSGIMTKARIISPKPKRYLKTLKGVFRGLKGHFYHEQANNEITRVNTGMVGRDDSYSNDSYRPDAAEAFLNKAKPTLEPRSGILNRAVMVVYRIKSFIFDSDVSAFGLRAAVAMTAGALPAFFVDSVGVFLRYRLIWITFTVLLGLQPVLGRGIAAMVFRVVGTIVGGVAGLVVVEIGRVPAGIIPVFFVSVLPQFYLLQTNPKAYLLPVLLSVITEDLVVGYQVMTDKLGIATVERSGQQYLQPPALMGYRILLTLAGIVIALFFTLCPALPTAKNLLRDNVAKHFFISADLYMLVAVRGAADRFDLPPAIDKAILQKQTETLISSATSQDLLGLTKFEPSPRGTMPVAAWTNLLTLIDNFNTALAVSNALFTRIEESDALRHIDMSKVAIHSARDEFFRVVSATLLALGNSFNLWQPLAPMLRSPVAAHTKTQTRLYEIGQLIHESKTGESVTTETITALGAHSIANAMMARYLEEIMDQASDLIGHSGFKTYLSAHRTSPTSKAE